MANNNPTTSFMWEDLFPQLFDKIPELFPDMKFRRKGRFMISPYKRDGSNPKNPNPQKTYIGIEFPGYVCENGTDNRTEKVRLIDYYAEKNGKDINSDEGFRNVLEELCKVANIDPPEISEEWIREYKKYQEQQERIIESFDRQKKDLFKPEGEAVLQYLKTERRYSEKKIQGMGLGYISRKEAEFLKKNTKVEIPFNTKTQEFITDKLYPLSFAFYSKGRIHGFKFRAITKEVEDKSGKYRNTTNLSKSGNQFGLFASINKDRKIVVVEGELDAKSLDYELKQKGISLPVIATTGGAVTPEYAYEIKRNGYKDIILLLDKDKPGEGYISTSIYNIEQSGLNSFIAVLPEGVKDPDDFFKFGHDIEEMLQILEKPLTSSRFFYNRLIRSYSNDPSELEYSELEEKFILLANGEKDTVRRAKLLSDFANRYGRGTVATFERAINEKANQERKEQDKETRKEQFEKTLNKALSDLKDGRTDEAVKEVFKIQKDMQVLSDRDNYKKYLYSNSDDIFLSLRTRPKGLNSGFQIEYTSDGVKRYQDLIFPEGGISLIGGSSNHGKSAVLKNIVLNALEDKTPGTLLYFTFEENVEAVTRQFINTYANVNLHRPDNRGNKPKTSNIPIIEEVMSGNDANLIEDYRKDIGTRQKFFNSVREFKTILDEQRLKIIRLNTNFHNELLGVLEYLLQEFPGKIRAVFVDYVQCLSVDNDGKTVIRTEEIKEVMTSIDKFAQETKLPFIMTAQLSRNAKSFNDLNNSLLSESSWIEKTASEILLLWSNRFKCDDKESNIDSRLKDGQGGVIGGRLTKSRRYEIPSFMFLNIDVCTGKITQYKADIEHRKEHSFDIEKICSDTMFEDEFFKGDKDAPTNKTKNVIIGILPTRTTITPPTPEFQDKGGSSDPEAINSNPSEDDDLPF